MDLDVSGYISSLLDTAYEELSRRKTFLNFSREDYFYSFLVVALLKSCVAGYGMVHVVPQRATYIFLLIIVFVAFLLNESLTGDIIHSTAHIGMLSLVHIVEEYAPSFPNIVIWYYYGTFLSPGEFFLDCYLCITIFIYLYQAYSSRPHKLTSILCMLFTVNWMSDQFVSGTTTSTFYNVILYYVPLLIMDSLNAGDVYPEVYGALWVIAKLARSDLTKSPFARWKETLHIDDLDYSDHLDAIRKRKYFLNVNGNEHYVIFNALLLLKSFIASYAVRNVVGVYTTLKMLSINFLLVICDRNVYVVLAGFVRFIFIAGYQYVLNIRQYHIALSSGIWFWVGCDDRFHFFLDLYLILSALIYINESYTGDCERLSTIICLLYIVDCYSDAVIGEPLGLIPTIATLYLPVILITAFKEIDVRYRVSAMLVFITLWLVFKYDSEYLEYANDKYIYEFYETA